MIKAGFIRDLGRRHQKRLVLGSHCGPGHGQPAPDQPFVHQPGQFPVAVVAQQLGEIGFIQSGLLGRQFYQRRSRFRSQIAGFGVYVRHSGDTGADVGFKSGRQQGRDRGEQGATVVGADPAAQLEMVGADEGRRFHRL